ncbi:MAG: hypothetical protein IJR87_01485 [Bacteroidaceae bacterium]|nr:hypothetical protein [Bacteroidaceae bacterium]
MKTRTKRLMAAAVVMLMTAVCSTALQAQEVSQAYKGYPSREGEIDIRSGFRNPPKGYGNVPFYWWTGDSLKLERLEEQLEILSEASTDGLCVSYNHTHAAVDTALNAAGHGPCGRVQSGSPYVMRDTEWWQIWNDFSARCADKGIGLGMDDYVVAWPRNGEFIDEVLNLPEIKNHQGRLMMALFGPADKKPEHILTVRKKEGTDSLFTVYTEPAPELSPSFGQQMINHYFQPFVDHMDAQGRKGMNYFFQDELQCNLNLHSWTPDLPGEFLRRKGYDVVPLLPDLFDANIDETRRDEISRTRLDYAEVVTQLAEERYFKPIYDWHAEKGLIYGSDNEGRGMAPTQYLDYFRVEKWFTAPGNDAPARGSSFTQTKVSSSAAHLYQRPRVWLEAFHSMGWDANGALLTHQLDHHLIAGGNLLCLHGLYYSTHGGWWEWAPPCFHFHMPYWPHMKVWLKYAERLCFLLSQGVHVADVAILYPTETLQAFPGSSPSLSFSVGNELSPHGIDYDFIDYASLQKAQIADRQLSISDENYRVLVLADTRAVHAETLQKIHEFAASGGIVVALGNSMKELQQDENIIKVGSPAEVRQLMLDKTTTDFKASSGEGRVLHRHVGNQEVYMVMDIPHGDELFFRSHGKVEVWDAQHGTITEVPALRTDEKGTWVHFDGEKEASRLYVFSPGTPVQETKLAEDKASGKVIPLEGDWDITIVPTMDNKWGDFRLPASPGKIGVEAREMKSFFLPGTGKLRPEELMAATSGTNYIYGYGPYMETATISSNRPIEEVVDEAYVSGKELAWQPYAFSWQYGVFDSPGSQGYHGLKAKVESKFLILDKGGHQLFRTHVFAPSTGDYRMVVEGVKPYGIRLDGKPAEAGPVTLQKGWHSLLIIYANTKEKGYSLEGMRSSSVDTRDRSMVMFYPAAEPEPKTVGEYEPIVASKWYGTKFLPFDIQRGEKGRWLYRFPSAPGTSAMHFEVKGKILCIWVDGKKTALPDSKGNLKLQEVNPHPVDVYVLGQAELGVSGADFFREPVGLTCEGGKMPVGDWTRQGALKFYSGGVSYRHAFRLDDTKGRVRLDLGAVDATCEVAVNGRPVDVLINKPYILDITDFVRTGDNEVEVLVYSSLANHYQTIPSPYKGTAHAGLLGPVTIRKENIRP